MFRFLHSLTYDGKRGTVLRLEDLGDRFRMSLVIINPIQRPADPPPPEVPEPTVNPKSERMGADSTNSSFVESRMSWEAFLASVAD